MGESLSPKIMDITTIKKLLNQYNLSPQKRFGQNFLVDETVILTMIETANLTKDDTVVEIGPGIGALTTQIIRKVKKIIAVEFDTNMVNILNSNYEINNANNLTILNQDVLDFNPTSYPDIKSNYKVIGSIPYQITSPLIHKLINWEVKPQLAVLLIQKEVAEKICSKTPNASYFSIFISAFGKAEIIKNVTSSSFYPSPKVQSAIIKINFENKKNLLEPAKFSKFLHHGFKNPRKMINKAFDKKLLLKNNINPELRPENLILDEWIKLYQN